MFTAATQRNNMVKHYIPFAEPAPAEIAGIVIPSDDRLAVDVTDRANLALYVKANKLVLGYNNNGTVTYLTTPLDGSTTAWTQTTTAP